jgi:hypothetical protein
MNAGDKFKKVYPFKSVLYSENSIYGLSVENIWVGGCYRETQDGAEIMNGCFEQVTDYSCDGEGFIEYEALAVVEMPRKYQCRVIYRVTMINPDGDEKRSSKAHVVTLSKFKKWINAPHSSYPHHYEVR